MNALVAERFVVLGGPLRVEGTHDARLIIRANSEPEIRERLAADPWNRMDLLRIRALRRGP